MMPKRWRIFLVLALMLMLSIFFRISMAVAAKDLAADLDLTASQLGVLSGIFFYAFAVAQLPLGPLLDRFGGRTIISLFGVLSTSGAVIFALAPSYHVAIVGRLLLGTGTACGLMGSLKIFTNWFTLQEFPAVAGFVIAAGNMGNLVATAPLAQAVIHFGWRPTFLAFSILQALAILTVFIVVRDSPNAKQKKSSMASQLGTEKTAAISAWPVLFRNSTFWLTSIMAFFWYGNYMVLQSLWGGPYLMEAVRLNRSQAGNVLIFTSVGFIIGSLSLGWVIESLSGSLKKTIMAGQTILLFSMTVMLGPAEWLPIPLLSGAFFAIGLASATGAIIYPMARSLVPHHCAATAMTGVNFFLLLGAAAIQHIMGLYIASFPQGSQGYPAHAYHGAFLIPILGLAAAIILYCFAREASNVKVQKTQPRGSKGFP